MLRRKIGIPEYGQWLLTAVLKDVPHRQLVLSILKRLRIYFMFDHKLLAKLSRCGWNVIRYLVRHHGHEGMFATLFFGVLDPKSGHLVYINGGHEPLYVIGKDGVKQDLPPTGPAVGLMENSNFKAQRLQIDPGDLLLGLTDGVTEACNPEEEFFTRTRVKDILAQPMASSRDLLERIRQRVFDFVKTAPRADDITMLAVQRMV